MCHVHTDTHVHINKSHEPEQGILHPWEDYELVLMETVMTAVRSIKVLLLCPGPRPLIPGGWYLTLWKVLFVYSCLLSQCLPRLAFNSWSSCRKRWDCRRASSCLALLLFLSYLSICLNDVNTSVRMCIRKPELDARCSLYYSLP